MKTRPDTASVSFISMLKCEVVDAKGASLGRLEDGIAWLRGHQYPLLTGLVLEAGGRHLFVPASSIKKIDQKQIKLADQNEPWRTFERREGEVLLIKDVLGRRLIDIDRIALVKAYDVRLAAAVDGWIIQGLDVHRHRWFQFGSHQDHAARDWHAFVLIGDQRTLKNRIATSRIRRLKPAQIADILEGASADEQELLLAQVHADPELEADVFEELQDDKQAQLLRGRNDNDVAAVLSRMRADDAADAIMDLPQERRSKVLDLLTQPQNKKVMTLLGYHDATAGGLMGTDFIAVPEDQSVADALDIIRRAVTQQPEALTTIYTLHPDGTLAGTLGLVRALQIEPSALLREAADRDTVVASPEDDIIAVTTRMADFNLLNLPVVDAAGRILGIVTVDDALEAAIPRDWSRRTAGGATHKMRSSSIHATRQ